MAEGDCTIYQGFIEYIMKKIIDCTADTFQMTLHTSYTPNVATHALWADSGVSSTEYTTANGYTAGGKAITTNRTVTRAAAVKMDMDDPATWTSLGPLSPATPSHAILWDTTPSSPADPLVCYFVLGTTATNGGNYTLSFNAAGVLTITA
jgi:hypothetical protein